MKICMAGTEAHLEGDWTLTGVTRNIDTLALSLQKLDPVNEKCLRVDCTQMKETDISGLQLLNVWMQCAKFRGVEPTLVNVPEKLKHAMKVLMRPFYPENCPDAPLLAG